MKIIRNNFDLEQFLSQYKKKVPTNLIGFVPTMGALHDGHISLISKAKQESDLVICCIFVNPTQFNEASDLEKYPRTIDADIELLKKNNCDVAFIPSESDIYPDKNIEYSIDLNGLDEVMEGKFRDNHFEGVCMVVERLFRLIEPNKGFFGIKDFQQVSIIKHMVKVKNLPVEIIACPIKREPSGLAMSSRNMLLSESEKEKASQISKSLFAGAEAYKNGFDIKTVYKTMYDILDKSTLKIEYLEIVNNDTLQSVDKITSNCTVCIAAYCGSVRLIDNCQFS